MQTSGWSNHAAARRKTKGDFQMAKAKGNAKLTEARLQAAVNGFQISILSISKLYRALEAAVAAGQSDAELKALVRQFPGAVEVQGS
jgi:hypothetical protein